MWVIWQERYERWIRESDVSDVRVMRECELMCKNNFSRRIKKKSHQTFVKHLTSRPHHIHLTSEFLSLSHSIFTFSALSLTRCLTLALCRCHSVSHSLLSNSLTLTLFFSLSHSLTLSFCDFLTLSLSHSIIMIYHSHSLALSSSHSLTLLLSHSLTLYHSLILSLSDKHTKIDESRFLETSISHVKFTFPLWLITDGKQNASKSINRDLA